METANHLSMKGKIVLVPFPFSEDFSVTKPRPAICLTDVIGKNNELIIAYITSKPETENLYSDITLENFKHYGLKTLSKIKLHKLVTITVDCIKTELGTVDDVMMQEIKNKLRQLFHF